MSHKLIKKLIELSLLKLSNLFRQVYIKQEHKFESLETINVEYKIITTRGTSYLKTTAYKSFIVRRFGNGMATKAKGHWSYSVEFW